MNITEIQSSSIFPKFLFRNHLDILPKVAQGVAQGVKDRKKKTCSGSVGMALLDAPTELEDTMWGKTSIGAVLSCIISIIPLRTIRSGMTQLYCLNYMY